MGTHCAFPSRCAQIAAQNPGPNAGPCFWARMRGSTGTFHEPMQCLNLSACCLLGCVRARRTLHTARVSAKLQCLAISCISVALHDIRVELSFACDRHTSTHRHPEFLGSCTSCTTRRQAHHHAYVSDPWLDTRTDTCVHRFVHAVPTQALYRNALVE